MTYAVATRTITQSGTDANLTGLKTLIDTGVVAATRSTAYTVGNVRKNDSADTAWWYQCTTAGTTSEIAPTWPTTDGTTVTDGTVVWTTRKAPTYVVTGATGNIRTEYKLESYNLNVTGTQTQDPDTEQLTFCEVPTSTAPVYVTGTGAYKLGIATTVNGVTRYSSGIAIYNSKNLGTTHGFAIVYIDSSVIRVNSSTASCVWNGGVVISPVGFRCQDGTFTVNSGVFECPYNSSSALPPVCCFNVAADSVTLRNLTLQGNTAKTGILVQVERAITIDNVTLLFGCGFGTGGSTIEAPAGTSTPIPVKNFAPKGNGLVGLAQTRTDYTFWRNNHLKAINALDGTASPCWGMDYTSNNAQNVGLVNFWKECAPLIKDASGAAVQDALVFLRDTNNSDRPADYRGFSWTADRTYNWTTDASGTGTTQEVLLGCQVKRVIATPFTGVEYSYRCPGGAAGADTFTFHVWSYGHTYNPIPVSLRGNSAATTAGTMITDSSISETDRATVAAYTTLETADKLRDYLKYLKTTVAYVETPTVSTEMGTPTGSTLNLGSYNLVVDATAASVFDLTGSTMTIKASSFSAGTKYSKISTTGTYSQANGATSSIQYTDATGSYVFLNLTGIQAGSRVRIYNVTDSVEIHNAVVAGTTLTLALPYTADKTLNIRSKYVTGTATCLRAEVTDTLTVNGFTKALSYAQCPVYAEYAVDGTTVTGFAADYVNTEVDITIAANFYISELYAWYMAQEQTLDGIRYFWGGLTAIDNGNVQINNAVVNIDLDNTTTSDVWALDNRRLFRVDGARPILNPTTGGGGVDVEWREKVLFVNDTTIAAIKAKTDLLPSDPASNTQVNTRLAASDYTAAPTSAANASAVRAELTTELNRMDATVSSRLATAGYTAPDNAGIAAIKAKTDTLTNAPSAAANASAVRAELATELARIDVPVSSVGGGSSPADIASAVRTELTTELNRMDAAVSSRLATGGYVAPDNTSIEAIKAKTDLLPGDPASNTQVAASATGVKNHVTAMAFAS